MAIGYTGLSFPFRLGKSGGLAMSTTSYKDPAHIEEAIQVRLLTYIRERLMNPEFGSNLDKYVFEGDRTSESLHSLIRKEVYLCLQKEDRIEVIESKINIFCDSNGRIYVNIPYTIIDYGLTYSTQVKFGKAS